MVVDVVEAERAEARLGMDREAHFARRAIGVHVVDRVIVAPPRFGKRRDFGGDPEAAVVGYVDDRGVFDGSVVVVPCDDGGTLALAGSGAFKGERIDRSHERGQDRSIGRVVGGGAGGGVIRQDVVAFGEVERAGIQVGVQVVVVDLKSEHRRGPRAAAGRGVGPLIHACRRERKHAGRCIDFPTRTHV